MSRLITRADRESIDDKTIIIFDHIPKCAGSSLHKWLSNELSSPPLGSSSRDELLHFPTHNISDGRLVFGHEAYGVHSLFTGEFSSAYITMIRNPLARIVSNYVYCVGQCVIDPSVDIDSYVLSSEPNFFVHWLGNGDVERAKERLFDTYCCFGVSEQFESSIDHFSYVLRTTNVSPLYEINKSSCDVDKKIKKKTFEYFMDMNKQDLGFYESAVKEFSSRLSRNERFKAVVRPRKIVERHEHHEYAGKDLNKNIYRKFKDVLDLKAVEGFGDIAYAMQELAQKFGGMKEAIALLERLHSCAPFRNVHTHVNLLLRMGRTDEAIELAEENWAVFSSHSSLPSDSRMYCFYFENLCLLINAYSGVDKNRMDELIEQAVQECKGETHLLGMLLSYLVHVGAYEDVVRICEGNLNEITVNNLGLHYSLGLAYHRLNMISQARKIFAEILNHAPLWLPAMSMLIVADRVSKDFSLDIGVFRDLAEYYHGSSFGGSLSREISVYYYEKGQKELALDICRNNAMRNKDSLIEEVYLANSSMLFENLNFDRCLVIKGGPDMVFDFCYDKFVATACASFDLISNFAADRALDYALVGSNIPFPSSRYIHSRDFPEISEKVKNGSYTSCIVLASSLDLADYSEIIKLALATGAGTVGLYSMDHMFSASHKSSLLALRTAS